jgi:DNA-binding NarL/FixJ family response regulator
MIRVVIADDQALVRGGIRMILETQADIEVVGEAADGDGAVAMTRKLAPDVVLMDIRTPTEFRRHARSPANALPATGRACSLSPHSTSTITYTRR